MVYALLCGVAATCWFAPTEVVAGKQKTGEAQQTVEGRLIDLICYTMGMTGPKHAKCALQCAQKGLPVGLLEEKTGKIYTLLLPAPELSAYMEQTVRILGKIHNEALLKPDKMEVKEGENWKEAKLPSAM